MTFFIYYEKESVKIGQGCGIKSNKYDKKPSKLYAPIQIIDTKLPAKLIRTSPLI